MSIFRSDEMERGTIILAADSAKYYVDALGRECNVQFIDMNERMINRPYRNSVQRIEDAEKKLSLILEEILKIPNLQYTKGRIADFLANDRDMDLNKIEEFIDKHHNTFLEMSQNNSKIEQSLSTATEERIVLEMSIELSPISKSHLAYLSPDGELSSMHFNAIAGCVSSIHQHTMTRIIFRATRGNSYLHFSRPISDNIFTDNKKNSNTNTNQVVAFVIFFQGSTDSHTFKKVSRIVQAFESRRYVWPIDISETNSRLDEVSHFINENSSLISLFSSARFREAHELTRVKRTGSNSVIEEWRLLLLKEKHLYHTLNKFVESRGSYGNTLRGDCWYPKASREKIKMLLDTSVRDLRRGLFSSYIPISIPIEVPSSFIIPVSDLNIKEKEKEKEKEKQFPSFPSSKGFLIQDCSSEIKPPTLIRQTELTSMFQELVNTYGIPRYGEVNPAIFTIVTFPFIFGIMYGDVGHGLLLLVCGLYAILMSPSLKSSDNSIMRNLSNARYILFAMGFFSVYCGLLYNDFLSTGIPLFTSRYEIKNVEQKVNNNNNINNNPSVSKMLELTPSPWFNHLNGDNNNYGPYPFGLDSAWHGASNELLFVNSLKMKLSVIVGVLQMILGICLKFMNSYKMRSYTDLCFECIPQMTMMLTFFFYMDYMIMYKWVTPIDHDTNLSGAPSIINTLISMGLGQPNKQPLFSGQDQIQKLLLTLTAISIPLMLFPKPLILFLQNKLSKTRNRLKEPLIKEKEDKETGIELSVDHQEEEFQFSEIFIHQVIETIEFVLGSISHTASYLRQWALSLAHQQLSLVFFQKLLQPSLEASGSWYHALLIYVSFAIFMIITAAVLLGMDVLECFLHTLRLHWVEFQSKFFKADGYLFEPYRHDSILKDSD